MLRIALQAGVQSLSSAPGDPLGQPGGRDEVVSGDLHAAIQCHVHAERAFISGPLQSDSDPNRLNGGWAFLFPHGVHVHSSEPFPCPPRRGGVREEAGEIRVVKLCGLRETRPCHSGQPLHLVTFHLDLAVK